MTPFFVQKEAMGEKIITRMKYGNVFIQMMMFSLLKVDNLRARKQERTKEKRNQKIQAIINQSPDIVSSLLPIY